MIMKNTIVLFALSFNIVLSQFGYPAEDFLGGGIGYSPMYIKLDSIPGSSHLNKLGLNPSNFSDPFVVHGGEGFAHVTGRWRIGGYAGMGGSSVSTIPNITIFIDENGNDSLDENESSKIYNDYFNPSIRAKFTFLLGAASVEYVMPLLQDLELSSGALLGLGRVGMALDQQNANTKWNQIFSNVYGTIDSSGTLLVGVADETEYNDSSLRPGPVPGLLRDVSAAFFNFQPYVAIKWQFLERVGLRISLGFNKGTVNAGAWKLNGKTQISDSPNAGISGITFRTMLYIGL